VRDTRLIPGVSTDPKPNVCLVFIVGGFFEFFGPGAVRYGPRTAIAMTLEQWEGASGRRSRTLRMGGENHSALRLNFAEAAVCGIPTLPAVIDLDDEAWAAAARAADLARNDDATFSESAHRVIRRAAALGYLTKEAAARAEMPPPHAVQQLWIALKPMIEQLVLGATTDMASDRTGLSSPQVMRAFQKLVSSFALVGPGLRAITLRLRLETAVILLSAPGATVTEVAGLVGYGSVDAMARAFRDAGLEAPSIIRHRLLETLEWRQPVASIG
jgi:AraC-like DNA-binding protein